MWVIDLGQRELMILELATTGALLGLVHLVARSHIPNEEAWRALWGPEDWSRVDR